MNTDTTSLAKHFADRPRFDSALRAEARRALLRLRKEWSVREIARALGKSPTYVHQLEHGRLRPSPEVGLWILRVDESLRNQEASNVSAK